MYVSCLGANTFSLVATVRISALKITSFRVFLDYIGQAAWSHFTVCVFFGPRLLQLFRRMLEPIFCCGAPELFRGLQNFIGQH